MSLRSGNGQDAATRTASGPATASSGHGHSYSKSHSGLGVGLNAAGVAGLPGSNAGLGNVNSTMDRSVSSTGGLSPSSAAATAAALANNAAKIRASVDAARTMYGGSSNGPASANPGIGLGYPSSPNLGSGPGQRGVSTTMPGRRPASELVGGTAGLAASASGNSAAMVSESELSNCLWRICVAFATEVRAIFCCTAEAIDKWFEDLHHYEATLEEMGTASLDKAFKEELGAIEQWFSVLSEAERTAALYSLLQTCTPVQNRFFSTVLQQMARLDPMSQLLSPANPQQGTKVVPLPCELR